MYLHVKRDEQIAVDNTGIHGSWQPGIGETLPKVQISPAEAVSRRSAAWTGVSGEVVEVRRRGRVDFDFCAPVHMLAVYERGVRQAGCTSVDGLPDSTLQDCGRKFVFVPAGCRYQDWQEPLTLARIAFFYFDRSLLSLDTTTDGGGRSPAPRLFFENSILWETVSKLTVLIQSPDQNSQPYLEALGVVLAHELVRFNSHRHCSDLQVTGGLAAWQRRRTVTYIEEHLAEPISLAVLAQLVHLSPNYFCRAFSQSFGVPPQRYQIGQRIERAKTLLAKRGESVTNISLSVGYSETSAFSTAFRRVTGQTPSAYRQNLS